MSNWKLIGTETIEVPVRSTGNIIRNEAIPFNIYKDDVVYMAKPECSREQMILANLKEELLFSFQHGKAIAASGIMDGNQHIAERIGALLHQEGKV